MAVAQGLLEHSHDLMRPLPSTSLAGVSQLNIVQCPVPQRDRNIHVPAQVYKKACAASDLADMV